jgi:hypothetical protein
MKFGLPFTPPPESQGRTKAVWVVVPQREVQALAFDVDATVVMDGDDLHLCGRLSWLERFLSLYPVHAVAGTIRTADLILRHHSTPDMSGLRREALLPTPVGIRPLRHPSHPRAWGWRAIQSELFDGVS